MGGASPSGRDAEEIAKGADYACPPGCSWGGCVERPQLPRHLIWNCLFWQCLKSVDREAGTEQPLGAGPGERRAGRAPQSSHTQHIPTLQPGHKARLPNKTRRGAPQSAPGELFPKQ